MEHIMPKLTFICEHEHPLTKTNVSTITYESKREYLDDILEDFRDFLKGCGFQIDGDITVTNNDQFDLSNISIDLDSPYNVDTITFGSVETIDSITNYGNSYNTERDQ